jgi:hypothetical protein
MKTQELRLSAVGLTRLEVAVLLSTIVLLVGIGLPAFTKVTECGCQSKNLSKAKQIYLGLKMYAGDHDERFPDASTNSNEAFQCLFPDYINKKDVFYLSHSAWTPNAPTKASLADKVLRAGENHFAYVPRLNSQSNLFLPLVADGFAEGNPGAYTSNLKAKGGVYKGLAAAVVRVDGSGMIEKVRASDHRVYGATSNGYGDLFTPAPGWLEADQLPLNPRDH